MEAGGGAAIVRGTRSATEHVSFNALTKNVLMLAAFMVVAWAAYSPTWFNEPAYPGWDANRSAASWDTAGWEWDWVDCLYFAMATMTTVGYGDMPALKQRMRLFLPRVTLPDQCASVPRRESKTRETRECAQRIRRDILVARRIRGGNVPALWGEYVCVTSKRNRHCRRSQTTHKLGP